MNCPGCRRENDPRRRYCGRCGFNLSPVCRQCSFANEHDDRFCGGCGVNLVASDCQIHGPAPAVAHQVAAPAAAPVVAMVDPARDATARHEVAAAMNAAMGELAGLFAAPVTTSEGPALPDTGIAQDDLDRLFGVAL